jgi:membrane associated rhomboid family serine protease
MTGAAAPPFEPAARPPARCRPWCTAACVAASALVSAWPAAVLRLEFDRAAVEAGETWRLLGSQFVHWSATMAVADLGVLLVAGAALEVRSRRATVAAIALALPFVAAALQFRSPELSNYRGSSGIALALVVALLLDLAISPGPAWRRMLAAAGLVTALVKTLVELRGGTPPLSVPLPDGVTVAPWVHAAGVAAGGLACAFDRRPRAPRGPPTR